MKTLLVEVFVDKRYFATCKVDRFLKPKEIFEFCIKKIAPDLENIDLEILDGSYTHEFARVDIITLPTSSYLDEDDCCY